MLSSEQYFLFTLVDLSNQFTNPASRCPEITPSPEARKYFSKPGILKKKSGHFFHFMAMFTIAAEIWLNEQICEVDARFSHKGQSSRSPIIGPVNKRCETPAVNQFF